MKWLRLTILTLLICLTSAIKADIKYSSYEENLGEIAEDRGVVATTFELTNDTNEEIVITDIRRSCSCLNVEYQREPIPAGASSTITVTYNPSGEVGKFRRSITVSTSASSYKQRLIITGEVIPTEQTLAYRYPIHVGDLWLSTQTLLFGELLSSGSSTALLFAYNHGNEPIELTFIERPEYITLPEKVTINAGDKSTIVAILDGARANDFGVIHDNFSINISAANDSASVTEIATAAIIHEDFSQLTQQQRMDAPVIDISTDRLHFKQLDLNADIIDSQKLTITNRGVNDLIIHKIYTSHSYINSRIIGNFVKAGESVEVTIYVTPSYIDPMVDILNEKITIISNDPTNPMKDVHIVGEITPINSTEYGTRRE